MKKIKLLSMVLPVLLAACVFFSSCKDDDDDFTNSLSVTPNEAISFENTVDSKVLNVETSAGNYNHTFDYDDASVTGWLSAVKDAEAGTLTITATANPDEKQRSAKLVVTADKARTVTISITQKAYVDPGTTPDPDELEVSGNLSFDAEDNDDKRFEITTNVEDGWDYEIVSRNPDTEWFTLEKRTGEDNYLYVVMTDNDIEAERTATIKFTAGQAEPITRTITQEAAELPMTGEVLLGTWQITAQGYQSWYTEPNTWTSECVELERGGETYYVFTTYEPGTDNGEAIYLQFAEGEIRMPNKLRAGDYAGFGKYDGFLRQDIVYATGGYDDAIPPQYIAAELGNEDYTRFSFTQQYDGKDIAFVLKAYADFSENGNFEYVSGFEDPFWDFVFIKLD